MLLSIGEASVMLGVSVSTLRRWERESRYSADERTLGGHRRYRSSRIREKFFPLARSEKRRVVGYARVSSHDQKEDLVRQVTRLKRYCRKQSQGYLIIDDLGSGMNYKKRGLRKLLKLIFTGSVSKLVLTHKDRLLRFGYELILRICEFFGTRVEVIEAVKTRSDEEILAFDVLEIITVFSARLYGKRAHAKKRLTSTP